MRLAASGTARFRPRMPADHPIDVTHRIGGIRDDILFLLVVSVAVRPLTWTRAVARSAGSPKRPALDTMRADIASHRRIDLERYLWRTRYRPALRRLWRWLLTGRTN